MTRTERRIDYRQEAKTVYGLRLRPGSPICPHVRCGDAMMFPEFGPIAADTPFQAISQVSTAKTITTNNNLLYYYVVVLGFFRHSL